MFSKFDQEFIFRMLDNLYSTPNGLSRTKGTNCRAASIVDKQDVSNWRNFKSGVDGGKASAKAYYISLGNCALPGRRSNQMRPGVLEDG